MRGRVRKRGSRWAVVYDEGRDEDGKRRQRWHGGFATLDPETIVALEAHREAQLVERAFSARATPTMTSSSSVRTASRSTRTD
jgi:Arm DNA-binding domain